MATIVNGAEVSDDPDYRYRPVHLVTAADGSVVVPAHDDWDVYALTAWDNSGCGQVVESPQNMASQIRLKSWASIRGRLMIGSKPGAAETIVAFPISDLLGLGITFDIHAQCDAQGNFVLPRIPPGRIIVGRRGPQNAKVEGGSIAIRKDLNLNAGQSVKIQLGGAGRPVVIRAIIPAQYASLDQVQWERCEICTVFPSLPDPTPANLKDKPREERDKWFQQFLTTNEGKKWTEHVDQLNASWTCYDAALQPDGSFRAEDVAPGKYRVSLSLDEEGPFDMAHLPQGPLASGEAEFTVADIAGGRTDEPLEACTIKLEPRQYVSVGGPAPDFTGTTLDGKPLRLSDFRGKYVLLDFWATWCGPCIAETPNLKETYQAFGHDTRFAMISISQDTIATDTRDYVTQNGLNWNQLFEARDGGQPIGSLYQIEGIPSIWLIGPDGTVVAKDLRGEAIKNAVAENLGNSQ
ncbi:MAG TPA: TlpA disulfide reductase family protein [Tepidisphaeraceae bacterium]|nr:TlpA disulfide reductase family protein [Tepidisphaeraceae bacterium]